VLSLEYATDIDFSTEKPGSLPSSFQMTVFSLQENGEFLIIPAHRKDALPETNRNNFVKMS
jgi:hypothetical protein